MFDANPSNVECFIGRQQEMYEISNLLDYHRLVSILGPPGIGKTSLARNLANYLKDRKKFSDGIIYVGLRGCESAQMFLTRLSLIIRSACSLDDYKKYGLEEIDRKNAQEIISKVEKDDIDGSRYRSFILNILKDKEVLLILDNAEDPLEDDNEGFTSELEAIIDSCPNIKLLATSRKCISKLTHNHEKPFILQPLTKEASLKLLITKAPRDIKNQELEELLKCDIPKNCKIGQNLNVKLGYTNNQKHTLLDHPFTALLGGHPQAISLAAPLLEYKSLKRLFYAFCDSNLMDAIDYDANTQNPNKSLRLSLELSINHMKNTMPEALNFFSFIGLMPGGINDDELTEMWGNDDWIKFKDSLVRASLLVYKTNSKGLFVYSMLPFMSIRAYELLEENEDRRHSYHMKCCTLYKNYCYGFYLNQMSFDKIELLAEIETNIWACIYRSLNRKKIIEYENDEVMSNYSDYFISDQERSLERLSISRLTKKAYKEKEEINTMEKLEEAEKESSSNATDQEEEGMKTPSNQKYSIKKLIADGETVNRSSERNYKSHFQFSPKQSEKDNEDEKKDDADPNEKHRYKHKTRRPRIKKAANIDEQCNSKFFDEEMLVLYYATNLIMLNKTADALKAITEYTQKPGISELGKANLFKAQAVLLTMNTEQNDVVKATKLFKEASAQFNAIGCKKGNGLCKLGLAKIYYGHYLELLEVMKDKNENSLFEKALNFVHNAIKAFKSIDFARGELYSSKLADVLKKKLDTKDDNRNDCRFYIELSKRAQKELGDIRGNKWIGDENAFLLEVIIDDFSHFPVTDKHLIRKVNGAIINRKAKKEHQRNNSKHKQYIKNPDSDLKIDDKPSKKKPLLLTEAPKRLIGPDEKPSNRSSFITKKVVGPEYPTIDDEEFSKDTISEFSKRPVASIQILPISTKQKAAPKIVPKIDTNLPLSIKIAEPRPLTPGKVKKPADPKAKDDQPREIWKY